MRPRTNINREAEGRFRSKKIKLIEARKSNGCQICRYSGHPASLDLHHISPSKKKYNMAQIIRRASIAALLDELEKCVVLCSNCHRNLHAGQIEIHLEKRTGRVWAAARG